MALSIIGLLIIVASIVITVLFLKAQSSFVDVIETSNPQLNTSKVWIWTQIIPIWALVAIPVTLLKINTQFQAFVQENNLGLNDVTYYSNVWGWVWFGANIASIFVPLAGIISFVGIIGFWIHINSVKKSILAYKLDTNDDVATSSK